MDEDQEPDEEWWQLNSPKETKKILLVTGQLAKSFVEKHCRDWSGKCIVSPARAVSLSPFSTRGRASSVPAATGRRRNGWTAT